MSGVKVSGGAAGNTATGIKVINCVVHDCEDIGIASWSYADNQECSGNLIYYNGKDDPNTYPGGPRGHGHGMYNESVNGPKLIQDNIVFRNIDKGIQLYDTNSARNYVTHTGNTLFNNSEISRSCDDDCDNLILWGYHFGEQSHAYYNMTYAPPWAFQTTNILGNSSNSHVEHNYFICSDANAPAFNVDTVNSTITNLTMSYNTFRGGLQNFTLNQYGSDNVQVTSEPNVPWIFVRPNAYEPGRANITIYNWPDANEVSVNISSVGLSVGQHYVVKDAQDFFNDPVATGTYGGSSITIPMTGLTSAAIMGLDPNLYPTPENTGPEFGCFVLLPSTEAGNYGPSVNAGGNQSITWPTSTVSLNGTVSDDGLPSDTLTQTWSKVSGAGTVTFADANAVDTTATFSTTGTYVLRLTASDGELSSSNDATISVNTEAGNDDPDVAVSFSSSITLPTNTASLDGTVTDDGLPSPPAATTVSWTKQSGAGTVTFTSSTSVDTTATFSTVGTYVLRLTATDSALSAYAEGTITVNPATNNDPNVNIASVAVMTWPENTASLDGTVTDDGLPNPPAAYTVSWTKQSGAGTVTFTSSTSVDTTATFSTLGTYVLRLTATDSALTSYAETNATVQAEGADILMKLLMDDSSGTIATDSSNGGANDGTLVNGPTWVAGHDGNAVHFDEVNDRMTVADFAYGPEFTLAFWFKLDDNTGASTQHILCHGTGGQNTLIIYLNEANASPANSLYTQVRDANDSNPSTCYFTLSIDANWHLYTMTVKSGEGTKVYLDANQMASDTEGGDSLNPTGSLFWGTRWDYSSSRFFGGSLDDIRMYNRPLSANEIEELFSGEVSNDAPSVGAGNDASITLPTNTSSLDGTVSDDGLPNPPATVTQTWSKQSGAGTVTFTNANAVDTTATFSTIGTYVLRLTASDSALSAYDEVAVTVKPANAAPSVGAGTDASITLPTNTASLDGTVSDDGLPNPPATVTQTWSKQSGAGTVTFTNANAVDTTATFSTSGTYVLRLTASDSSLSAYDEKSVTVNPANTAPSVGAGSDASITLPTNTASLDGTVSDDGLPGGGLTQTWSKQSGAGTVTFTNANAVDTTATFSTSGTYVLRLTASDTALTGQDEVSITVNPDAGMPSPLMKLLMDDGSGTVASDSSGNNHPATLINGPTWVAGHDGNAVQLDETNDYMRVTDFSYGPEFTWSFWFKVSDNTGNAEQYLLDHNGWGAVNSVAVIVRENGSGTDPNKVATCVRDGNDSSGMNVLFNVPTAGTWHLYTLTVETGVDCKVYLDANQVGSDANRGGSSINPNYNIYLGSRWDASTSRLLGGSMDDVRLYNDALTEEQVNTLFNE